MATSKSLCILEPWFSPLQSRYNTSALLGVMIRRDVCKVPRRVPSMLSKQQRLLLHDYNCRGHLYKLLAVNSWVLWVPTLSFSSRHIPGCSFLGHSWYPGKRMDSPTLGNPGDPPRQGLRVSRVAQQYHLVAVSCSKLFTDQISSWSKDLDTPWKSPSSGVPPRLTCWSQHPPRSLPMPYIRVKE